MKTKHIYEFGKFRLDAAERVLLEYGKPVALPPKVLDTLLAIVEHSGHIIEKEELIKRVWPDSFVEENNLNKNISALRKVLGEGQDEQRYIETIPKRGYRFVARVTEVLGEDEALIVEEHSRSQILIEDAEEISGLGSYGEPGRGYQENVLIRSESRIQIASTGQPANASLIEASPTADATPFSDRLKRHKTAVIVAGVMLLIAAAGGIIGLRQLKSDKRSALAPASFQTMKIRQLTATGKVQVSAISRDGRYVVHTIAEGRRQSLWLKQLATDSAVQIIGPDYVSYRGITFSPDGNYVYSPILKVGHSVSTLYRIPILGGPPTKLLDDLSGPVTFSPDGSRIAFSRDNPAEKETSIVIANIDGTAERKLASLKSPEHFSYHGAAWSPDGKVIVCGAGLGRSDMTMVEIKVEDGAIKPITSETWSTVFRVAWFHDGSSLVFSASKEGGTWMPQLYLLSYPDGSVRRITNDLNRYGRLSLSLTADSETLVTDQYQRLLNIWVAPRGDPRSAKQITSGAPVKEEGRWDFAGRRQARSSTARFQVTARLSPSWKRMGPMKNN